MTRTGADLVSFGVQLVKDEGLKERIRPCSEERGPSEGGNTTTKITSDEVFSEGCRGLTRLPMY